MREVNNFSKKLLISTFLFVSIFLITSFLDIRGVRKPFLYQYISFNNYFSYIDAGLKFLLICVFFSYCYGIGNYLLRKIHVLLPTSFIIGIGLVTINIILLPFFFLRLFTVTYLLFLFLLLSIPARLGLNKIKIEFWKNYAKWILSVYLGRT